MLQREEDTVSNTVSNISRTESYCTTSFLHTQIQGLLFVSVDFCGASSCSRTGCRQVARYMHDPNGIIDARSASPLAPDLAAAISDEGLWNLASSLSPCNQEYTMRSDISILDRNVSQFGIWNIIWRFFEVSAAERSKMPALTYVYGASLAIGGIFAYQGQWKLGMWVLRDHARLRETVSACLLSCVTLLCALSRRSSKAALGWGLLFGSMLCWSGLQVRWFCKPPHVSTIFLI